MEEKPKIIKITYYALLREQRGLSEEEIQTTASTPAELYAELQKQHSFNLSTDILKVAVNNAFADWKISLKNGDHLTFIPPVAGG
ncbi:MAG: MoaD/ThiS family protein [Candidatus Omnitrophica bacterium]|nr:MoaD/ThiS family protein [Candidatus Omnitrophota bacterium]